LDNKKEYGILGGMGPASTVHFLNLFVEYQQKLGCVQDEDFNKVIIYNTALTEWDNTGFVNALSVKKQLISEIKKLENFGCDVIGIPCNTVHHFYQEMQDSISVPIVNMVKETALRVIEAKIKTVGLICTRSTRELGVYERYLSGIEIIYSIEQSTIDDVILDIQAGRHQNKSLIKLSRIVNSLIDSGAEAVIVGCTELSIPLHNSKLPLFDSSKILVESLLSKLPTHAKRWDGL